MVSMRRALFEFKRISVFLFTLGSFMNLRSCNQRDLSKFYFSGLTFYFGVILNLKKSCKEFLFRQFHQLFTFCFMCFIILYLYQHIYNTNYL